MANRIDQQSPLLPTAGQVRKAEDTDTRQAIQRHDPEFYREKKEKKENAELDDPYEDFADVSVPALKNFLMGLLDRIAQGQGNDAPLTTAPVTDSTRPAASPQAAAAVNAYQTGARRGSAVPPPPVTAPPPQAASALDQAAAGLDRAVVLDLIRDLDRLYGEGITGINLVKGEGLMASIRDAIDRAREARV